MPGRRAGLTVAADKRSSIEFTVPTPPLLEGARFDSVRAALEDGPKSYSALMAALGTRDGREVVIELEALREEEGLTRLKEGEYALKD